MLKKLLLVGVVVLVATAGSVPAVTNFTNSLGDNDFNNAGNWDNGLPDADDDAVIANGLTAETTGSYGSTGPDWVCTVGASGTEGVLTVNAGHTLIKGNRENLFVGAGAGSVGTVNVYGTLSIRGTGSDVIVGDSAGGSGTVNVFDGGFLDARKATEIINGRIEYAAGAVSEPAQDEYVVDNGGTVAFVTDGAAIATVNGTTLALELGSGSTLEMILGGTFDVGDSWTLFDGLTTITGVDGGDGTGVFGSITSNIGGAVFDIAYTPESAAGAGDGTVVATLTSFKVKPSLPDDGATGVLVTANLEWAPGPTANVTAYDVIFGAEPNELHPAYDMTKIVDKELRTSVDVPAAGGDLGYSKTYYWQVTVYEPNKAGAGEIVTTAPLWSFTTEPPEPQITGGPAGVTVPAGAAAELSVEFKNVETFKWYREGDLNPLVDVAGKISGAGTSMLTISNVDLTDEGSYYFVGSNTISPVEAKSGLAQLMTARLVGWWKLDGNLDDSVTDEVPGAPSHNGTASDPNLVAGGMDGGGAYEFFDDGRVVVIADSNEFFNFYPSGMTVNAWVNTNAVNGSATVASKRTNAQDRGWLLRCADNSVFTLEQATQETASGQDSLVDGQWHMLTGQYDGRTVKLFVDGVLAAETVENTNVIGTHPEALVFGGARPNGGGPFLGLVDDIRIWSYALDSLEIARMYANITGEDVCPEFPDYDFNKDCVENMADFAELAAVWLNSNIVNP